MRGRDRRGATVITTIDATLQRVAAEALGTRRGGVAAIDPATGEVLVLVSNPSFDPNTLAVLDVDAGERELRGPRAEHAPDAAAVDRVAAAVPSRVDVQDRDRRGGARERDRPEHAVPEPAGARPAEHRRGARELRRRPLPGGASQITLAQALQVSCNVVFGEIGLELGADRLVPGAASASASTRRSHSDVNFAEGSIPSVEDFEQNLPGVAHLGDRPAERAVRTRCTWRWWPGPSANRGVVMRPQFVREIRDPHGPHRALDPPGGVRAGAVGGERPDPDRR